MMDKYYRNLLTVLRNISDRVK